MQREEGTHTFKSLGPLFGFFLQFHELDCVTSLMFHCTLLILFTVRFVLALSTDRPSFLPSKCILQNES